MCQKIEDCLLSKIGFRIFLSVIFSVVVFALLLNFQILTGSKVNSVIQDTILRKIKETTNDDRRLDQFPFQNKQNDEERNITQSQKTKILVWIRKSRDEENSFYTEFSHRIRRLRRKECPILNECTFASNKNKFHRADAVVIVSDGYQRNLTNNRFFDEIENDNYYNDEVNLNGNNRYKYNKKIWSLLIQNPFDQRNKDTTVKIITEKFGISEINYFISYMPDADIPLLQYSLKRKISNQKNRVMKGTKIFSMRPFDYIDAEKRETIPAILSTIKTNNDTRGISKHLRIAYKRNNSMLAKLKTQRAYGANNGNGMNTLNNPIHSFSNYHELITNKSYLHTTFKKSKNQFVELRNKNITGLDEIFKKDITNIRRRRSDRTNESYHKRLAAVIMNECNTEGNREGMLC